MNNYYVFKPYNPIFPQLFESEKKRLLTFLKKDYRIEHVGSTAVPGLGGKGIIDICIIVPDEDKDTVWNDLVKAGYDVRQNFNPDSHVSHTIYLPDPIDGERKYHIHVRNSESKWVKEALAFRDYLMKHPEDIKKYAIAKKKAAEEANGDRDKYLAVKGPVIDDIYKRALEEIDRKLASLKAIIIGTSLSGKTTLMNYLRLKDNLPLLEMDDELIRANNGTYPEDIEYKHKVLVPQIIKEVLDKKEVIFFTNTDYFTEEDLKTAKNKGFKIVQLEVSLEELKRRNGARVKKEGRDDWGKWLEGMLRYQEDMRSKGLFVKVISMNQPIEKSAEDLLIFLGL